MKRAVVVGSAIVDITVRSSAFKVMKNHEVKGGVALCEVYGGKMDVSEMMMTVGGAGTNVAVGLVRLGVVVSSLVRIGKDLFGELVLADLKSEGVETGLVQVATDGRTGMSVILVADDGGRSIMSYRGVSKEIESNEVDWDKVGRANWIQISSVGGNYSLIEDIVSYAINKGVRIGFNPGKGEFTDLERLKKILARVDLLVVNKSEAEMILRLSERKKLELVTALADLGVKRVIVTEGRRGAAMFSEGKLLEMEARRVNSIDDTGAGDAFCAGVVAGILQEKKSEEVLQMGIVNGASEVTKMGVKNGLLSEKEMVRWMKKKLKVVEEKV